MSHIHTEFGQHDHTVSAYVIRTDLDEPKIMLHLHRKFGRYAQFGGHIELNETPWQAIAHELEEESGYALNDVQILQPSKRLVGINGGVTHPQTVAHVTMRHLNEQNHAHTDISYVFIAKKAPTKPPQEGESTDIRLFTRDEISSLKEVDPMTRDITLHVFDHILPKWQPVSTSEFEL